MKRLVIGILAAIGLLSLLVAAVALAIGLVSLAARPGVPSHVILEVDFERGVIESVPEDPVAQYMFEGSIELRDVIEALERARDDDRVLGLFAHIGGEGLNQAHIEEIRDAVQRFREAGKPAVAFAETFGEFGPGNGGYYLATAFDRIELQPSGDVGLTGLIYESMFYRGLIDKLGMTPRMDQRYEYKNAMNVYTDKAYTPAHREAMQAVLDSRFKLIVDGVAERLQKTPDEVRALIDRGPFLGQEAVDAGLVDGLAYRDEALDELRQQVEEHDARLLYLGAYLKRAGRPHQKGTTVALIHGNGTVMRGPSGFSPLTGEVVMGSETVARAFRAAVRDSSVKAILFRVDSPGGSFVASDTIRREVVRARERGKPVVVSMGNLAGSGGYYVSMEADRIVAEPSTITASIGVLGGKILTRGFWEKVGITWDEVHGSAHADQWSPRIDYGPEQYARFEDSLDRVYEDFTGHVAKSRDLPLERVREIAKGRIWTGVDAKELGLVDELGGYDVALAAIRELLDEEPDAPLQLKRFPAKRSTFDVLFGEEPDSSEHAAGLILRRTLAALQPELRALREVGLLGDPGVLTMPDVSGVD